MFFKIKKKSLVTYIKNGTDGTRTKKRTFWCIACICPDNSKRFEYVSCALLNAEKFTFSKKAKIPD